MDKELDSSCELAVMLCRRFCVGFCSSLDGLEKAKAYTAPVHSNGRSPLTSRFMPVNALVSRFVGRLFGGISIVSKPSREPQISKPIIGSVSVDVVNVARWVNAGHVEKGKPVRVMFAPINTYVNVPVFSYCPGGHSYNGMVSASARAPYKYACVRFVLQSLSELLVSQRFHRWRIA